MTVQDVAVDLETFAHEWRDWRSRQQARLADPHGFLAITSLHWLDGTPQRFDDAPGAWSTGPQGVRVLLDEGEKLIVDGTAVHGEYAFRVLDERASLWSRHVAAHPLVALCRS